MTHPFPMPPVHRFVPVVAKAVRSCSLSSEVDAAAQDDIALLARGFEDLGFDSLAFMEFCVSVYMDTGVEIDVDQARALQTPLAVAEFLGGRS